MKVPQDRRIAKEAALRHSIYGLAIAAGVATRATVSG